MFFALLPPRKAAEAMHAWALEAQRNCGGRVTRAETIHLTLAFLGEVDAGLDAGLQGISATTRRHSLPIEQARYWARNRIVWAGPRQTPGALQSLVSSLELELKKNSFRTENRVFSAHITLIRETRQTTELSPLPAVDWPVEQFVLVRSRLSSEGPSYEVVGRFPLK